MLVEDLAEGEFFNCGCYWIEQVAGRVEERGAFFNGLLGLPAQMNPARGVEALGALLPGS